MIITVKGLIIRRAGGIRRWAERRRASLCGRASFCGCGCAGRRIRTGGRQCTGWSDAGYGRDGAGGGRRSGYGWGPGRRDGNGWGGRLSNY